MEIINQLNSYNLELETLREKTKLVMCDAKAILLASENEKSQLLASLKDSVSIPHTSSDKENLEEKTGQICEIGVELGSHQKEDYKSDPAVSGPKVALNYLVMKNIFGYLKLEDLKKCRQTCTHWEAYSQSLFLKTSKPLISSIPRCPKEFRDYFGDVSTLEFSNIGFTNSLCSSSVFADILQRHFLKLRSLVLDNITLRGENGKLSHFDLSPFIGDSLTTLVVNSNDSINTNVTRMTLSDKNLASAEYLTLKFCTLVLSESLAKIKAKEYHFRNVSFSLENKKKIIPSVDKYSSNLINFHQFFQNTTTNGSDGCTFQLKTDQTGEIMETLYLSYWDFGNNILRNAKGLKSLTITGIVTKFEWSYLPDTIESLFLDFYAVDDSRVAFLNYPRNFLPNLKVLDCKFIDGIQWLPVFRGCHKLAQVKLQSSFTSIQVDLNWLPRCVQDLHMTRVVASVREEYFFKLESLSLVGCPPFYIRSHLEKFRAENLLLINDVDTWATAMPLCIQISHLPFKSFVIGNLKWKDAWEFNNSPFAHCVDKMSKYYVFQNGFGKAMHKSDANKFII